MSLESIGDVKFLTFAENLKRLQAERGESNYRLAKELGVSKTTITNWQTGNKPNNLSLRAIAAHYGVTVEELTGGGDTT